MGMPGRKKMQNAKCKMQMAKCKWQMQMANGKTVIPSSIVKARRCASPDKKRTSHKDNHHAENLPQPIL
jgi:hypothetical protein